MVIYIIIGLLVLSVILISHELGHFITAKMTGVRVEEFGLGYPPRIWGFKRGETTYSINAIPFGGFNKLTGEEDAADPRSLAAKSRRARLLVITGGTVANILLSFVFFTVSFMFPQQRWEGNVKIEAVSEQSAAETAGLAVGDLILAVDGEPLRDNNTLSLLIQEHLGETITLEVRRPDESVVFIDVTPRLNPPEGQGHLGVMTSLADPVAIPYRHSLWKVVPLGLEEMWNVIKTWGEGLASIFRSESPASFVGPVALVQLTGEGAKFGIVPLLQIAGLISLILGITNMFPIPALDGSRVVFLIIEAVRGGKRLQPKTEGIIHFVGFALLILFSIVITFQDIIRIIHGESLLG